MTNTRFELANPIPHLEKQGDAVPPPVPSLNLARASHTPGAGSEGKYVAVSPHGAEIEIPKELFVALQDFMKTRKSPGSITIHFREGEITCVEAVAKKTYRNS